MGVVMSSSSVPVITIDGPSGTGKGTLCQMLAKTLGWHMLDSGAIYRVLAYAIIKDDLSKDAVAAIVDRAKNLDLKFEFTAHGESRTLLDNDDVTDSIRSENCGQTASEIAAIPEVRAALLERQKAFAKAPGLVTDGRDMGTIVFPNAYLKIYLDASEDERAKRRHQQLQDSGNNASLAQVVEELKLRDSRDKGRSHAPLVKAEDAVYFDTTRLTIVQVLNSVLELVHSRA